MFRAMLILCTLLTTMTAFGEPEKVLYNFEGGADGADPYQSGVVMDKSGNLYGVVSADGLEGSCSGFGCGLVYELSPTSGGGWEKTTLHTFTGGNDGGSPVGNLIIDAKGNLYGVTEQGGTGGCNSVLGVGCGVVFRMSPKSNGVWKYSVIHDFGNDGNYPNAGVVFDGAGNLYGTTQFGGDFVCDCGIVYQLVPVKKGTWTENTLYNFVGISQGGSDVSFPGSDVFIDAKGNIFGTGTGGGDVNCNDGCGGVYELVLQENGTYQEQVLHAFTGGRDGFEPDGGVLLDSKGNVYGTTGFGGGTGCNNGGFGCGTVFELRKSGGGYEERIVFRFNGRNGYNPVADLYLDDNNNLYSTTTSGGAYSNGVAFRLTRSSGKWKETVLHSFGSGSDGASSWASLTSDGKGGFFGTTRGGGTAQQGTVFQLLP